MQHNTTCYNHFCICLNISTVKGYNSGKSKCQIPGNQKKQRITKLEFIVSPLSKKNTKDSVEYPQHITSQLLRGPSIDGIRDRVFVEEEPRVHLRLEVDGFHLREAGLVDVALRFAVQATAVEQTRPDSKVGHEVMEVSH